MSSISRAARVGAASLALLGAFALPGLAQAQRHAASVTGSVQGKDQSPIESAEISMVGVERVARSNADGTFRLDSVPPGQYLVQVRRLGFKPLLFSATLVADETREWEIELLALPSRLSAVQIKARSELSPSDQQRLRDFQTRRQLGFGRFLTRDDLDRSQAGTARLSDVMAQQIPLLFNAAHARPTPAYSINAQNVWAANVGQSGRTCRSVSVSWNGGPAVAQSLDDISSSLIDAVEIYRPGQVPANLGNSHGRCVVVLWTS